MTFAHGENGIGGEACAPSSAPKGAVPMLPPLCDEASEAAFPASPAGPGENLLPDRLAGALEREFDVAGREIGARWLRRFRSDGDAARSLEAPARHGECEDVLCLLLEHADRTDPHTATLARWIAFSCLGENHLWEDLGLPDRPALSALIARRFSGLHAKNVGNMRWKKFFYKQLCERAEVFACRAPSCGMCSEYPACFDVSGERPWSSKADREESP